MKLKAKQKIVAAAIFILAIVLLLGSGAYPLMRNIVDLSDQIANKRVQLEVVEKDQQNIQDFRLYSRDRAQELDRIDTIFVNANTPVEFLEYLEGAALQSGTAIQIAPSAAARAKEERWASMRIRITGDGSYPQFRNVLHLLENAPFLLEVNDVQVQRGGAAGVTFSLGLKAYAQ